MARMELTDQKHSSDSIASEQEVTRSLEKRLKDYHFEYVKLKRKVNLLEAELDDLDECVDRKTVVDLIYEIAPLSNIKKCKDSSYLSESSEESDLVEIIEIREKKDAPHKQQRRA
ncbi:hypothetical protein C1646_773814 [Rhizophagus diaphanus]|nr:hypothetical protein C1646_773814 [Rhizophagus diaphanus] [Rhizophagus sp. MUCL 43196]